MTATNSALTFDKLRVLYNTVRSVLNVHPEDLDQPLVAEFRAAGYSIEPHSYMPKGKALMNNVADMGIIDFEKGTAVLWKNELLLEPSPLPKEFKW